MGKRIGYARVSSRGQERDGNSLETQKEKLENAGCDEIVMEAYTGATMDRPKFSKLVKKLQAGDTLVVCKVDRFSRTLREGLDIVDELRKRGVAVHILNMGLLEDTPNGDLMFKIWLAFAEFEKAMIAERLNDGKEMAKQKNPDYKEGRKEIEIPANFENYESMIATGNMTVKEACLQVGVSRTTWYKWRKEYGSVI